MLVDLTLGWIAYQGKWHISQATLWPLMERWRPGLEGVPDWARKPAKRAGGPAREGRARRVKPPTQKASEVKIEEQQRRQLLVEVEYEGYRRGVRETLQASMGVSTL